MPQVGDVLADRYRIEAVLGAGGMATVRRATDLRLERQVAVKVLGTRIDDLRRDGKLDCALADELLDATRALVSALAAIPAGGG